MTKEQSIKLAKKYIKKEPMPNSLKQQFKKHGMENLLKDVYEHTAEMIVDNKHASKERMAHLEQILPSIAFYKVLLEKEGSQEKALAAFEKWCFIRIEQMAKWIPRLLKIPGLYKKVPAIMKIMLDKIFGHMAGFDYIEVEQENGFAVNMTICPYVETCKKYGCPELTQFFCKSDDICYGNMHPKLVWGRTKTLGMGADCCDFSLWIKKE